MKKFLVFIERQPQFTGESIPNHLRYIQQLREQDILVAAGGFTDQTGGAYILQANSLEEAVKLAENDPMFMENTCIYKVKEWNVK
ncbi:YciI family protein [Fodinisporobacter ferrooxydans]|uniref:YciI family protein n=1 Tax=Fodinisporobacter ferrooxydans TaxID=2901836 RepID=A0ABY4CJE8_9BACL|nr:YciI family protein [Alicyclobacillaceae bacterium MYW30-H2]